MTHIHNPHNYLDEMATAMTTPPAYFSSIPAYSYADAYLQSTPAYSDTPDASERTLQSTSHDNPLPSIANANLSLSRAFTQPPEVSVIKDFIYNTDHMEVNLGSRMWGLRTPAYGRLGHIEGSVKFLGEQAHVSCVELRVSILIYPITYTIRI